VIGGRSPKMQEDTNYVLSEEAIKMYLLYYP
jgi:hypothetical protein